MIAIIDYDSGNTASVMNAFRTLGEEVILTDNKEVLLSADRVVLPGVGAFGDAMKKLNERDLIDTIKEIVDRGTPFLGICLGMQLLFEESEESPGVRGLSLLPGKFLRFPEDPDLKVPQIGWNDLSFLHTSKLFEGIEQGTHVYFVHSYYLPVNENTDFIAATTQYGVTVGAAVEQNNLFGCQFHPEKSAEAGRRILMNFLG